VKLVAATATFAALATNSSFPPFLDAGAGRTELQLTGASTKIANGRIWGAKQPLA
jgi:hypothetical protein